MAHSVRFHPEAAEEVQAVSDRYRERSADAAAGFIAELNYAIERVAELPETWPSYKANNEKVHLSYISLQPRVPDCGERDRNRCRCALQAQAWVLDVPSGLAFGRSPLTLNGTVFRVLRDGARLPWNAAPAS